MHQSPAYSTFPVDYKVPDFGLSHEIIYTENNIKNAEKSLNHNINASFDAKKGPENPRDYPVADFGLDRDIKASLNNLEMEEKRLGFWSLDGKYPAQNAPTNAYEEITKLEDEGKPKKKSGGGKKNKGGKKGKKLAQGPVDVGELSD